MKTLAFIVFISALLAGLAFGVARDLYSQERAVLSGTIANITAATGGHKSTPATASALDVLLTDGRTVHVMAPNVASLTNGTPVSISEMATPWGQVWYKLR